MSDAVPLTNANRGTRIQPLSQMQLLDIAALLEKNRTSQENPEGRTLWTIEAIAEYFGYGLPKSFHKRLKRSNYRIRLMPVLEEIPHGD